MIRLCQDEVMILLDLYFVCRAFLVLYVIPISSLFIALFILSANVYFSPLRLKSHLSIIKIALW